MALGRSAPRAEPVVTKFMRTPPDREARASLGGVVGLTLFFKCMLHNRNW